MSTESSEGMGFSNQGYDTGSVMQLRIDTRPLLEDIDNYLRGRALSHYKQLDDGGLEPVFEQSVERPVNDLGRGHLMHHLSLLFNSHTVQGNFKPDDLDEYIFHLRQELAKTLMINLNKWGVSTMNYDGIIDSICRTAYAFFSRLLYNAERGSYGQSQRFVETSRVEQGGGFSLFRRS